MNSPRSVRRPSTPWRTSATALALPTRHRRQHRHSSVSPTAVVVRRLTVDPDASGRARRRGRVAVDGRGQDVGHRGPVDHVPPGARGLAGRGEQAQAGHLGSVSAAPPPTLPHVSEGDGVLVEAAGLTKRFGAFTAVDGIDFQVLQARRSGSSGRTGPGSPRRGWWAASRRSVGARCGSSVLDAATQGPRIRARLGVVPQQDSLDEEDAPGEPRGLRPLLRHPSAGRAQGGRAPRSRSSRTGPTSVEPLSGA